MPAIPYARFQAEVLEIYDTMAPATRKKMAQALREFGALEHTDEAGHVDRVTTTADLRPVLIARWLKAHPERSPSTNKSLLSNFRAACTIGCGSGYIDTNPFALKRRWITVPDPSPDLHHSAADIARVLHSLDDEAQAEPEHFKRQRLRAVAYLVAFTGMRKLEALGLEWPDIDLGERLINLQPNQWRKLKTKASGQILPIAPALGAVLAHWRTLARSLTVVFPNELDTPWFHGAPGYRPLDQLKAAGKRAGVDGLTFQSLRQSWATHAETLWELSEPSIQRVLRQTTPVISRKHYRKADKANIQAIGTRLFFPTATG